MTDIDPKALALRVAAEVCHEDQMIVWSSEFAEALQEFISDDLDYSDIVALHSAIDRGLRDIVRCALEHPETERALAAFLREAVSPWIKITSAEVLPKKPGLKSYEYVDCLIFHNGEIKKRPWNCEHLCWDDEEYDDFYCGPMEPSYYMLLPTPPAAGGKNAE